jgi:hypothetical protein
MDGGGEIPLDPVVRLSNGRTIRTVAQAIAFLREHETRPGVDDRDEVLHQLERAKSDADRAKAIARFRAWLSDWGVTIPVATDPQSTRGPGV